MYDEILLFTVYSRYFMGNRFTMPSRKYEVCAPKQTMLSIRFAGVNAEVLG